MQTLLISPPTLGKTFGVQVDRLRLSVAKKSRVSVAALIIDRKRRRAAYLKAMLYGSDPVFELKPNVVLPVYVRRVDAVQPLDGRDIVQHRRFVVNGIRAPVLVSLK